MVWDKELSSRSQPSLAPGGGCFTRGVYKGKYQIYVKLRFETLDIIFNDLWPQKWIPGQILILLDTHNLSVRQKLPYSDLPKMANGNGKWQMWQCLIWAIFDLQTSHGCLKVSEFYQESDSEDENHLRQFLKSEIKLLCFCEFLPCNSRRQP